LGPGPSLAAMHCESGLLTGQGCWRGDTFDFQLKPLPARRTHTTAGLGQPPSGSGNPVAVDITGAGDFGGVRKRCPKVGTMQLIVRNAYCYCAASDSTAFSGGTQAQLTGIMWQKPSTTGAAINEAKPLPCNLEADPNSCIQAECQGRIGGGSGCASMQLHILCGPPY
jgi:hypothetical protein